MDISKLPVELCFLIFGHLSQKTRPGFLHLFILRLVSKQWRKLVSRLAVHLHLRVPQSSENILKLAQLFPGAVCLAFDPQGIFDYGVLNGFRLRKLSLRSLTSPETLCNLPSSISRLTISVAFKQQRYPSEIYFALTAEMFSSVSSSLTKLRFRCDNQCHDIPLHLFTNLTELYWHCYCTKKQPALNSLSTLTNLVVFETQTMVEPEALSTLTKLQHLQLREAFAPHRFHRFRSLTNLQAIEGNLGVTRESLLSLAEHLPKLKYVSNSSELLFRHQILSAFTGLTTLYLAAHSDANLSQLSSLSHLTKLAIPAGPNVLPFLASSARSLRELQFFPERELFDCDVDQIVTFCNLRLLRLHHVPVSQSMIDRICKALRSSLEFLAFSQLASITSLKSIALCSRLQTLILDGCVGLGQRGLAHLTGLKNLRFLDVSDLPKVRLSMLKNAKFRNEITNLCWVGKARKYSEEDIAVISTFPYVKILSYNSLPKHQLRQLLWNVRLENIQLRVKDMSKVKLLIKCAFAARRPIFRSLLELHIITLFDNPEQYELLWAKLCELPALTRLHVKGNFSSSDSIQALKEKCQQPKVQVSFSVHFPDD